MKKKLLQIGIEVNSGSTGRIAEEIGELVISKGWESYITYARGYNPSKSKIIKIGNRFFILLHILKTRLFGNHLLASDLPTKKLISQIKKISPDIIHLHQIHGYYLNVKILFDFLGIYGKPIIWTLHDCWAFTGHCSYFTVAKCDKWIKECNNCPQFNKYPKSLFVDRSKENYYLKKFLFNNLKDVVFVGVSDWVKQLASKSFLSSQKIIHIPNGVDTEIFSPNNNDNELRKKYNIPNDKFLLIASGTTWIKSKGIDDYIKLRELLCEEYVIILVGVNKEVASKLPKGIIGIPRTESKKELANLYSISQILLCLSYQESFGLTPIEAFACGTPAIVYENTGLKELVTAVTGRKIETGNLKSLVNAIEEIRKIGKENFSNACIERARKIYDSKVTYQKYVTLYDEVLKNKL